MPSSDSCVFVYDVGGSHVSAAVFTQEASRLGQVVRVAHRDEQSSQEFVEALKSLADQAAPTDCNILGASLAMPGPFDYKTGASWMRHKMPNLYGVNLRDKLAERMGWQPGQVHFLNDAAAFLLGEVSAGAARGLSRVVGITLGTGIGSAFAIGGKIQTEGTGVPPGGEVWNLPFEGGTVEDLISTRSIKQSYKNQTGREREVEEIAACAASDPTAKEVFTEFGRDLARVLKTLLNDFAPEAVVLGGGIARSADLFLPAARHELQNPGTKLCVSLLGDHAPLVGAGVAWFADSQSRT
jgi:glucokinase